MKFKNVYNKSPFWWWVVTFLFFAGGFVLFVIGLHGVSNSSESNSVMAVFGAVGLGIAIAMFISGLIFKNKKTYDAVGPIKLVF